MFLAGRACAGTALTLFRATVLWQIYDLTHQPIALAALGLAQFVPAAIASLPAGAAADRTTAARSIAGMNRTHMTFSAQKGDQIDALDARTGLRGSIAFGP